MCALLTVATFRVYTPGSNTWTTKAPAGTDELLILA